MTFSVFFRVSLVDFVSIIVILLFSHDFFQLGTRLIEQSLFMTGTGTEEIWEGGLEKMQYPKRGFKKVFHSKEIFCVLQIPKNPGGTQP